MFLRCKRAKGHEYLVLVENYWDGERVRQRTIRHFGRRDRLNVAHVLQTLAELPGYGMIQRPSR